jgi:hypothetical protein
VKELRGLIRYLIECAQIIGLALAIITLVLLWVHVMKGLNLL